MKSEFYTDGKGNHQITLSPENDVEKAMVEVMNVYRAEIEASKITVPGSSEPLCLVIKFTESSCKSPKNSSS